MLMPRTILSLALLASVTVAHAQFGIVPGGASMPGAMMNGARFQNVATGAQSNHPTAGLYRFLDENGLRNHWQRFGLTGPIPPKIDWINDQVVIVHLGQRPTGGYGLFLAGVQKSADGRAQLAVTETVPLEGQILTQAVTSPYIAIAIERTIPSFTVAWGKAPVGGIVGTLPPGSTVLIGPGTTTIIPPLVGGCGPYGGDYYSLCEAPGEFWIESDDDLRRYGQTFLNDPRALPTGFDWRAERLLAVHLGPRESVVAIESLGFERKGRSAVLRLAERPGRANLRSKAPISPFLLVRVARDVRNVRVEWDGAKKR